MFRKLIILFSFVIILAGCENKFQPPKTDYNKSEIPDQESWNSSVVFSDSGKIKAILKAGHISVYNTLNYTLVDSGAVVDFYKDGEIVSTLTGKRGKVLEPSKDIEMYDSVIVVSNKNNTTVNTQKMYWNNKSQKVSSDAFVKIKSPKEDIEGYGFESDQNLKNYKIYRVTGILDK